MSTDTIWPGIDGERVQEARLARATQADIDAMTALERQAYPHPWQRSHFMDALDSGYTLQCLLGADDALLGYYVAMLGVDEAHLLNVCVAPAHQGQGWGRVLLDDLDRWARSHRAQWLWLEVRVSNTRARDIYLSHGYREVGQRKGYYPAAQGQREDALVMCLPL